MRRAITVTAFAAMLVAGSVAAAPADEALRRGQNEFRAGQYAQAIADLTLAAENLQAEAQTVPRALAGEMIDRQETALVYLAVSFARSGREADAHDTILRIAALEQQQPRFASLLLDPELAEFNELAARLAPSQLPENASLAHPESTPLPAVTPAATPEENVFAPDPRVIEIPEPPTGAPSGLTSGGVEPAAPRATTLGEAIGIAPMPVTAAPTATSPAPMAATTAPMATTPAPTATTSAPTTPAPMPLTPTPMPMPAPPTASSPTPPTEVVVPMPLPAESQPMVTVQPAAVPTSDVPSIVERRVPSGAAGDELRRAESYAASGDITSAAAIYDRLLDAPDASRDVLIEVATGLYRIDAFERAVVAFRRIGELQRGEEDLRYYHAVSLFETGAYDEAKKELNCALPFLELTADVAHYREMIDEMAQAASVPRFSLE
jgi:Flp pilus assembly protein TadD